MDLMLNCGKRSHTFSVTTDAKSAVIQPQSFKSRLRICWVNYLRNQFGHHHILEKRQLEKS
ncbi:hypothetical protein PHMEG_00021638 [Phytophthora megakarya]|uniref:Uncharacterized protein n=1 Tax=Phytophthora megakarya TaxID=4795 RepID=A0A225VLD9_9STRA|nr:hypothetical protein PHMEG_00021638 [Phytophthora megakarya]